MPPISLEELDIFLANLGPLIDIDGYNLHIESELRTCVRQPQRAATIFRSDLYDGCGLTFPEEDWIESKIKWILAADKAAPSVTHRALLNLQEILARNIADRRSAR
jgi:hypothetical protein